MATRNTRACDTLRINRFGTPNATKTARPSKKDPAIVVQSDKCKFFSWQDSNLVDMITTKHTDATFMKRTRSKTTDSGWQERNKPKAVEFILYSN